MKKIIKNSFLLVSIVLFSSTVSANLNSEKLAKINQLNRFAFGSCNKEFEEQFVWDEVLNSKAQLFIWGGDNIYGDSAPLKDQIAEKYTVQNNNLSYAKMKQTTPIIGTWDDHDFGKNDSGKEFAKKEENRILALDFLLVPKDAPVRSRDGVYQSFEFGEGAKKVKFILLDNRYNQTSETILGKAQWSWLEDELRNSDAKIHFIVGGLAILPNNVIRSDEWADWPNEKRKLINLIEKYNTPGVVFLTGDKHFSAITRKHGLLEIMSSGMTHTKKGFLVKSYMRLLFKRTFFKKSFAIVDIDWEKSPILLSVEFKGIKKSKKTIFELSDNQFILKEKIN